MRLHAASHPILYFTKQCTSPILMVASSNLVLVCGALRTSAVPVVTLLICIISACVQLYPLAVSVFWRSDAGIPLAVCPSASSIQKRASAPFMVSIPARARSSTRGKMPDSIQHMSACQDGATRFFLSWKLRRCALQSCVTMKKLAKRMIRRCACI